MFCITLCLTLNYINIYQNTNNDSVHIVFIHVVYSFLVYNLTAISWTYLCSFSKILLLSNYHSYFILHYVCGMIKVTNPLSTHTTCRVWFINNAVHNKIQIECNEQVLNERIYPFLWIEVIILRKFDQYYNRMGPMSVFCWLPYS